MADFEIVTWAGRYANKWLVVRAHDQRIMTESASVYECLRWVRTWGDTNIGRFKKGQPLSPAYVEALQSPLDQSPRQDPL